MCKGQKPYELQSDDEAVERVVRATCASYLAKKQNKKDRMGYTRAHGVSHIGGEVRFALIGRRRNPSRRVEHVKRGSAHHRGGASGIVRSVVVRVEGS
jgi:hypothetical protein